MVVLAAGFGIVIGLSLGLLGGGGSILAVPALVYALGQPVQQAVTTSLLVVGSASLAGAISHVRAGHVPWRTGVLFGLAGVGGSFLGALVNHRLDQRLLLAAFAGFMVVTAVAMLRRAGASDRRAGAAGPTDPWRRLPVLLATGFGVGAVTGLFGVGGGFIIVPALVVLLRFPMPVAVGTSLVVIAINSATGFLAHLGFGAIDPRVAVPFAAGGLAGAVAGQRLSARIPADRLTKAFAYLILAVAGFVAVQVLVMGGPVVG
jgi:uncharacterized protein